MPSQEMINHTWAPPVNFSRDALDGLCFRYQVKRLAIFGSAARSELRPDSDIDVLVEFDSSVKVSFITLARLQRELAIIFSCPVDLVPQNGLKPLIRDQVLKEAQEIYAA